MFTAVHRSWVSLLSTFWGWHGANVHPSLLALHMTVKPKLSIGEGWNRVWYQTPLIDSYKAIWTRLIQLLRDSCLLFSLSRPNLAIWCIIEDLRRWQLFIPVVYHDGAAAAIFVLLAWDGTLWHTPSYSATAGAQRGGGSVCGSFSHFGVPYKSSGPGLMLSNEKRQRHTMLVDDVSFLATQTWAKWANQPSSSWPAALACLLTWVLSCPMGVNN